MLSRFLTANKSKLSVCILLLTRNSFASSKKVFSRSFFQSLRPSPTSQLLTTNVIHLFRQPALFHSSMSSQDSNAPAPVEAPVEHFRLDYKPSDYTIPSTCLSFQLDDVETIVVSTSQVHRQSSNSSADLVLDGEKVTLLGAKVNSVPLTAEDYTVHTDKLVIKGTSLSSRLSGQADFELEITVQINPSTNTALCGLYKSNTMLCTQCEAMGFRKITYWLDRPDVLTKFKVRLEAEKERFPLLLSNGNPVVTSESVEGKPSRHFAVWDDPFPKPSYLFAVVAGNLKSIHDTFTTSSGRNVKIGIYSDITTDVSKLNFAMYSLKTAMKWDETTFGLEYDLDYFNIVATNDFNMGAMENKGLNIFNSAYVLAEPQSATDIDYENILGVVAHEYFHNWTGNRVTVRDWFQLTLKEGLTVFRDQWFSSDQTSNAVKRISDVRGLRSVQFAEDNGPMKHPIRPDSYISMDNFYTSTVYRKGAEVVRMYRTLLGTEGFKKGMKLYFQRHDGGAVSCDDFRNAMADANGVNLDTMDRWYSQAGTPLLQVKQQYDAASGVFSLTVSQSVPASPQHADSPLPIPVLVALFDPVTQQQVVPETLLQLTQKEQTFTFSGLTGEQRPVVSFLRDFSAPVKVTIEGQTDDDLIFLLAHDTDPFNQWDAGQRYMINLVMQLTQSGGDASAADSAVPAAFIDALKELLKQSLQPGKDLSIPAYSLQLPDLSSLLTILMDSSAGSSEGVNLDSLVSAYGLVKKTIAFQLREQLLSVYKHHTASGAKGFEFNPAAVGRRRLLNTCLGYLSVPEPSTFGESVFLAKTQFDASQCMTDKAAALMALTGLESPERSEALQKFYTDAHGDALVLNKWFAIQAAADVPNLLEQLKVLKAHPDFIISNPNRARSLLTTFAMNIKHFHAADGKGYEFLADAIIELDAINPQVAARLSTQFLLWRRLDESRRAIIEGHLKRIHNTKPLSSDTFEIIARCLK